MAQSTFTPRDIYRSFRAERNEALHPVLRRLPDRFLAALIEGLEQADVITPGRLFAGDRGGCAVGVTLRVLNPRLPRAAADLGPATAQVDLQDALRRGK